MDEQHTPRSSEQADEQIVITLELDSTEHESDPALVLAVGNTTVADVLQEQYVLRRNYTGHKGGFLAQFVVVAQFIIDHHAEIITGLSDLVTIFGKVLPIVQKMVQAHKKHVSKEESERTPLKIEVEIDGAPIRIEASDLAEAEAALKLARRFHSAHPGVKPTAQSKITIRSQVPPRKRPARR